MTKVMIILQTFAPLDPTKWNKALSNTGRDKKGVIALQIDKQKLRKPASTLCNSVGLIHENTNQSTLSDQLSFDILNGCLGLWSSKNQIGQYGKKIWQNARSTDLFSSLVHRDEQQTISSTPQNTTGNVVINFKKHKRDIIWNNYLITICAWNI